MEALGEVPIKMVGRLAGARNGRGHRPFQARRWRASRSGRGVSDVVATILLLALTVTLFGTIFAFVTRFPAPPAQDVNQFQASLVQTASGVTQLKVLQDGGPVVAPGDNVFLQSSRAVTNWQFQRVTGIPVSWGTGNSSGWSTGQYWTTTFSPAIKIPENITVYVLSASTLLFMGVVPGSQQNVPPLVTATYTLPSNPGLKAAFKIFADVSGNTTGLNINVSLSEIPGLSGTPSMTYNSTAAAWMYSVPAGETTTNGTYLAFVQGSSSLGTVAGSLSVTIGGSGSSGGGGGSSVAVGMSPPPPLLPQETPSAYFWATVTYSGTKANVPVWVNFTISQLAGVRAVPFYVNTTIPGQTGLTISGPSSLTVYSQSSYNFNTWLLNSSIQITAKATLGSGVGSATGSIAFQTPNYVNGSAYITSSSTGALSSSTHSLSHSCSTSTSCPYLYLTVWNNWTTARGGPASLSFSGTVYSNITSCASGCTATSYTIGSTSVTQASSTAVNVAGGTARWKPGGSNLVAGDKFTIVAVLTVTDAGVTVGYTYDTWLVTLT
jgi:FlaG/FlaF family flagellin (archaellin)